MDSDVTDAEITNIITWVDAVIDMKISVGLVTAPFLELLSSTYCAYRIMLKDPNARSLGEYSENRTETIKALKEELDWFFDAGASAGGAGGVNIVAAMEPI